MRLWAVRPRRERVSRLAHRSSSPPRPAPRSAQADLAYAAADMATIEERLANAEQRMAEERAQADADQEAAAAKERARIEKKQRMPTLPVAKA